MAVVAGKEWHVEVQEVEVSQIRFLPRNWILNSCKSTLFVRHSLSLLILITQLLHDLTTVLTCSSSSLSLAAYNTTRSSTASSSTLFKMDNNGLEAKVGRVCPAVLSTNLTLTCQLGPKSIHYAWPTFSWVPRIRSCGEEDDRGSRSSHHGPQFYGYYRPNNHSGKRVASLWHVWHWV